MACWLAPYCWVAYEQNLWEYQHFQKQVSWVREALVRELRKHLRELLPSQQVDAEKSHSRNQHALLSWLGEASLLLSGCWTL